MFNGTTALLHLPGRNIHPALHGVEHAFVLPAPNTPFLAGRTLRFEFTTLAGGRVVAVTIGRLRPMNDDAAVALRRGSDIRRSL